MEGDNATGGRCSMGGDAVQCGMRFDVAFEQNSTGRLAGGS